MVAKTRKGSGGRSRTGRLNYFFLDGNLHYNLKITRATDTILTWCYPLRKRMIYNYSDVLRRHKPAFSTREVSEMIERHRDRIEIAIQSGGIKTPQYTYSLSGGEKKLYRYMWSDENIMELHDYFLNVHRGRPRADGKVTPGNMPSKAELRAKIASDEVLYRKDEDGNLVPVWRAQY
jgi:hypothetical protein